MCFIPKNFNGVIIMNEKDIKFWSDVSLDMMHEASEVISPLVGTKKGGEIVKMGADGTPTKLIDIAAENKVVEILEATGRPVTLISEEIGELKIGEGASEVVFVVDPLDGTSNAIKNIPAYGISVAVADASKESKTIKSTQSELKSSPFRDPSTGGTDNLTIKDIELGFVQNFATGDVYEGVKGCGATLNGKKLTPSTVQDISTSSVGAYIYRADMGKIDGLCKAVRRMRILGSVAIELCYVADGTYDAFIDIRGTLRIVDVSAAKLIIEETKGLVTDESCKELDGKLNVLERTSIIASCNQNIHKDIIRILGGI